MDETSSSFSSDADDQYLLRAVNAIEENNAAFSDISDDELSSFLDENYDSLESAPRDERAHVATQSPSPSLSSSLQSSPEDQFDLPNEELARLLHQIDAYELRQLPCAPPSEDGVNVGASTSSYVEDPDTVHSLKRPWQPLKYDEKVKKK